MRRTLLPIAIVSCMLGTTHAQEAPLGDRIADVFARDGIVVDMGPQAGASFPSVTVQVPGHIRSDGWFIASKPVSLGGARVSDDGKADIPALSFPLAGADVALLGGHVDGLDIMPGGLLAQRLQALSFGPVTFTGRDGVFLSIDKATATRGEDACIALDLQGVALSVRQVLPAIAPSTKDFYKGHGRILVDCDGSRWRISVLELSGTGWGDLKVRLDISFEPQRLIDVIIARRESMNVLFGANLVPERIVDAEVALYRELASLVSFEAIDARFENAGFADGVGKALPAIAAAAGATAQLTEMLLGAKLPEDLAARIGSPLAAFLESPKELRLGLEAEAGTTLLDLVDGKIPATAWTLENGAAP